MSVDLGTLHGSIELNTDGVEDGRVRAVAIVTALGQQGSQASTAAGHQIAAGLETGLSGVATALGTSTAQVTADINGLGVQGHSLATASGQQISAGLQTGLTGMEQAADSSAAEVTGSIDDLGTTGASAAVAAGLAIGVALGAALTASLTQAIDAEAANSKLKAQLGLNAADAARLGKTAGALYSQNYSDGLEGVNEALRFVIQNIDGMASASEADLQKVTKGVLNLSSAFDTDLAGSTRTISTLIRTGLAQDAGEALDILTAGLQSGVNVADDLLDTFDEYSTVFRTMGVQGEDALGLLQQGLQGGARDADQVADSLKELLLRVQAGDATGGLQAIGLDAQKMARDISLGGETAATATDQIIDAFTGIIDPADKAQIGMALFGTKSEDAQMALNGLDLSTAAADFEKLNGPIMGASDAMDNALGGSRAAAIETFKRSIEGAGTAVGTALLPAVDILLITLGGLAETVGAVVGWFSDLPVPLQLAAAGALALGIAFTAVGTAIKTAFLANPVGIIITGIVTALGWLVGSTDSAAESAAAHQEAVDALTETLDKNTGAITANTRQSVVNDIGAARIRELKQLGINTADYTEAILGNGVAQERVQSQIVKAAAAAIKADESYLQLSDGLKAAGVSAEDMAKAVLNQDFTGINEKIYTYNDGLTAGQTALADFTAETIATAGAQDAMETAVSGVKGAYDELNGKTKEVSDAQVDFKTKAEAASGALAGFPGKTEDANAAIRDLGGSAQATKVDLSKLGGEAAAMEPPLSDMAYAMGSSADQADILSEAVNQVRVNIDALNGRVPSVDEATQALNDSMRELVQSATDSEGAITQLDAGIVQADGSINTATESGSKFQDQITAIADDALKTAVAQAQLAGSTGTMTDATNAARESTASSRAEFIRQVGQLGIVGAEAEALANKYGLVPDQVATAVSATGIIQTKADLDQIQGYQLANKTLGVNVDSAAAWAELSLLQQTKYAQIVVKTITGGSSNVGGASANPGGYTGGYIDQLMGFASGGKIPGQTPSDPTFDNLIAQGPGGPLRVQSGEFLVNSGATRANERALEYVNAGGVIPMTGTTPAAMATAPDVHNYNSNYTFPITVLQRLTTQELVRVQREMEFVSGQNR